MKTEEYEYSNCPIPGGGYVTGFCFNSNEKGILYIRTDIGGSYRYLYDENRWVSLTESVNMNDLRQTFPIALCSDKKASNVLYIISGTNPKRGGDSKGLLSISEDFGNTYSSFDLPFFAHGNLNGRGTGPRLVQTENETDDLLYASQKDGLWRISSDGKRIEKLSLTEEFLTFVYTFDRGRIILVGTAGLTRAVSEMRGAGLYISRDSGESFEQLFTLENFFDSESKMSGFVPHRICSDDKYLYITFNYTGKYNYEVPMGYSCDSGDMIHGRIIRIAVDSLENEVSFENITPDFDTPNDDYGFGGISICPQYPGLVGASTMCRDKGDEIFISKDYGKTWEVALFDLEKGNMHFNTSYMKPEYNGGHSLIHWLSDIAINPFDPDEIWFNTGTGVFRGSNFTKDNRSFEDCCRGIEETVHLNVYSLPKGPVRVLDILGDLGGFAFDNELKECENSFSNENKDRYITCINADFSDMDSSLIVVSARGNWTGKTKGGLIFSKDYCKSFERPELPFGISEYIDELLKGIEMPNVNPGWIALSSDNRSLVFSVAQGYSLFMKGCISSQDQGKHYQKTKVFDLEGNDISFSDLPFKTYSDSVNSSVFYGFSDGLRVFISKDSGVTFNEIECSLKFDKIKTGLIDVANKADIKRSTGCEGVFYASFENEGLYKFTFNIEEGLITAEKLTAENETVFRMGLGVGGPGEDIKSSHKAVFISGIIKGHYGFYRTVDDGKNWVLLNDDIHQFGDINALCGDAREFGQFYIGTGSFGLKVGKRLNSGGC